MKASDLFLRCLESEGVKVIFGVPGEENADLMISLMDSPIEFVVCRHEQVASFMADMYGRLTGEPGVCISTLGPGATNLITGVASANMDHAPLVAVIGQTNTRRLHKESHQNMDSVSMFRPVSKWVTTVRDAINIPEVVRKAFKVAMLEKQGACVIELPEDIAKEESDLSPLIAFYSKPHGGVETHLIEQAAYLIESAHTPILLIGNGCVRGDASAQVLDFVEKTGIYATHTFMGKGVLSDRHDHSLYCAGLSLNDIVIDAFRDADLVICLGYDMVEWHPERWDIGASKRIIHIDTQPAEVDLKYGVTLELVGDIAETLEALIARIADDAGRVFPHFAAIRKRITEELEAYSNDDGFPVKPQRILSDLRAALGDEDILVSDVGAHKLWIARNYPTYAPNTCIITNGFCSMGFALPGAMMAKKLYPEKNVVAVCGDGGFLMNVQDLITAVRYGIPLTVMIWDDNGYGMIKWKQEMTFCKHNNVDLTNPDFVKLAESFGCKGINVASASDLRPALERAFEEKKVPTIITVPVEYGENLELTRKTGDFTCPLT